MKILIVEDEKRLAGSLKTLLMERNYDAECVYDGLSGYEYAVSGIYDLLILDVLMPVMDGISLLKRLRKEKISVPVLMLTAKSELSDRINGLDSGADYYLTKPFDERELLSAINALLRRQGNEVNELNFGNTSLDLETDSLLANGMEIRLSAKEFEVMRMLMQQKEKNLSKEIILTKVWGYDSDAVENHVEVYIGFLRKKLKSIGSNVSITAARRLGYHLEIQES